MAAGDDEVVILESPDEDQEEEITTLDIEGENEEEIEAELNKAEEEELKKDKKKKLLIIGILGFILIFMTILIIFLIIALKTDKKPPKITDTSTIIEDIQKKKDEPKFTSSKVDKMLQRANFLYERGNKIEALDLYKDIATYNEAISQYNIGVAQMKEGNCKEALVAFKNAILNKEKRTISSINGAICALMINDEKLFKYYLDLAYAYLPEEASSPLYSYYMGLINFYSGNYYEALSAFSHPTSEYYKDKQNYLVSKIASFLDLPLISLNALQGQSTYNDQLALGLLYARIGEYDLAYNSLKSALNNVKNTQFASMAMGFVELKRGNFATSAEIFKMIYDNNATFAKNTFPIKTILNRSLFNVDVAQDEYRKNVFFEKENQYALLFYYAPYKVFSVKESVDLIRKGGLNVFVDQIDSGLDYLNASSTISKINESMSGAIQKALSHHYIQANEQLKKLIKIYPQHAILHYNLALTYAQLGNYTLSHKHFLSSYRLDSKNYLAGLFAVLCGDLIGKNNKKLLEEIKADIDTDENLDEVNFFMTLAHFSENNQFSIARWIDENKDDTPLNLIFDIIGADMVQNTSKYYEKIDKLKKILPHDIMAEILYINTKYNNKNMKQYAKQIQSRLHKSNLNMSAFYYGSSLIKEQYIKMLQLSGLLHVKKNELQEWLKYEQTDSIGIMQALAFMNLYTNDFEEAFLIYNSLIDDHKIQDTNTIFYAAVASIGANHPENAIALLELSKLIDPNNFESRFALGLLYHEIKNIEGAVIQYENIGNNGFKSKYFSFDVIE